MTSETIAFLAGLLTYALLKQVVIWKRNRQFEKAWERNAAHYQMRVDPAYKQENDTTPKE